MTAAVLRFRATRAPCGLSFVSRRTLARAFLGFLNAWACLFLLSACKPTREVVPPGTIYLVLVDKSMSAATDSSMYHDSLQNVVSTLKDGDRFLIAPITAASGSDFRQLKDHVLPDAIPPAGMTDEPIKVRKAQEAQQKQNKVVRDAIGVDVDALLSRPSDAKRTAIFESLRTVAPLFLGESRRAKILIVLSDMVEDSEVADFERDVISQGFTERELKRQTSSGMLPNLHGVSVCVGGALASPPEKAAALERFWDKYFEASGAILRPGRYARVLTSCSD